MKLAGGNLLPQIKMFHAFELYLLALGATCELIDIAYCQILAVVAFGLRQIKIASF